MFSMIVSGIRSASSPEPMISVNFCCGLSDLAASAKRWYHFVSLAVSWR